MRWMLSIAVFLAWLPAAAGQAAHPPLPQYVQLGHLPKVAAEHAASHSAAYLRASGS